MLRAGPVRLRPILMTSFATLAAAVPAALALHGFGLSINTMTLGGLAVDPGTCGVLNTEGKVIPGLYAGGTIVNWAFGKPFEINGITTYRGAQSNTNWTQYPYGSVGANAAAR